MQNNNNGKIFLIQQVDKIKSSKLIFAECKSAMPKENMKYYSI